jgi:hypothetical protein
MKCDHHSFVKKKIMLAVTDQVLSQNKLTITSLAFTVVLKGGEKEQKRTRPPKERATDRDRDI